MVPVFRLDTGPPSPSAPSRAWARSRRLVASCFLALLALDFTGCSSCSPFRERSACEPVVERDNFFRRMGRRLFGPRDAVTVVPGAVGCCPTALGEPVVPVVPGAAVVPAPGVVAVPGGPGAISAPVAVPQGRGVVPGGPAGSVDPEDQQLEQIPSRGASNGRGVAPPAGGGGPQGRAGTLDRGNYQTQRTPDPTRAARVEGLARARLNTTTEPAVRPARPNSSAGTSGPVSQLLDNLPPLSAAPAPDTADQPSAQSRPPLPIDDGPPSQLDLGPVPTAIELPSPAEDSPETAIVGIRRFRNLERGLAGGSLPNGDGLAWLREKGYRTLVDLRDPVEVHQSEVDTLSHLGLKHIKVPIDPKQIDTDAIAKFESALADADARPVYFFDTDGNRAGLAWYLHRTQVDKVAADLASREAERLGLTDMRLFLHAAEYLRRVRGKTSDTDPFTKTSHDRGADVEQGDPFPEPVLGPEARARSLEGMLNWQPYTAPVAALLCVPLAYWGRTTIVNLGSKVLASLPAPARSTRSLPRA